MDALQSSQGGAQQQQGQATPVASLAPAIAGPVLSRYPQPQSPMSGQDALMMQRMLDQRAQAEAAERAMTQPPPRNNAGLNDVVNQMFGGQ